MGGVCPPRRLLSSVHCRLRRSAQWPQQWSVCVLSPCRLPLHDIACAFKRPQLHGQLGWFQCWDITSNDARTFLGMSSDTHRSGISGSYRRHFAQIE